MALHTAMIGGVRVPGFRSVVHGARRGCVSTHRTVRCLPVAGRGDAPVDRWRGTWVPMGEEIDVEPAELPAAKPAGGYSAARRRRASRQSEMVAR